MKHQWPIFRTDHDGPFIEKGSIQYNEILLYHINALDACVKKHGIATNSPTDLRTGSSYHEESCNRFRQLALPEFSTIIHECPTDNCADCFLNYRDGFVDEETNTEILKLKFENLLK